MLTVQVSIAAVEERAAALVEPTLMELAWEGASTNQPMSTPQLAQLMFDTQVLLLLNPPHPHRHHLHIHMDRQRTCVCPAGGRSGGTQWAGREGWRCVGCRGWTRCTPRI